MARSQGKGHRGHGGGLPGEKERRTAATESGDAHSLSPGLVLCPPLPEGLAGPFWRQKCPPTEPKRGDPKDHSTLFETGSFERSLQAAK